MKTFFDSIGERARDFFVRTPREMTPAELKAHFSENVNTLKFELKKETEVLKEAEKNSVDLKFKAVDAPTERDRKFILQQYVAETRKANDAKNRAEAYMRRITVFEKDLSLLSLSESLSNALGEKVPFDALMREFAGMEGDFEKMNEILKEMEHQADLLDRQLADSEENSSGAAASIDVLSALIEKMKHETDPARKADLEREYNAAMEKLADPATED